MSKATAAKAAQRNSENRRQGALRGQTKRYGSYYLLLILPILYFLIFRYGPIIGNILAFRKYAPGKSIYGVEWAQPWYKYFAQFLSDDSFWTAFKNTLILSVLNILFTCTLPIVFAILLGEVRSRKTRNTIQMISFFPHFISTVVVVGMLKELLSPSTGLVNLLITKLGGESIFFLNEPQYFRPIYIISEIWQHMGWNSIIYYAALVNIDPQLYEAAEIDGATRLQRILKITLPMLAPTIAVVLITTLGSVLSLGFEKVLLMYTPSNAATSDIVDTFVYRIGVEKSAYSFATAVGLFGGVIGCILVTTSNWLSKKLTGESVY